MSAGCSCSSSKSGSPYARASHADKPSELTALCRLCVAHQVGIITPEALLKYMESALSFWKLESVAKFVDFDRVFQWEGMIALIRERTNGT